MYKGKPSPFAEGTVGHWADMDSWLQGGLQACCRESCPPARQRLTQKAEGDSRDADALTSLQSPVLQQHSQACFC